MEMANGMTLEGPVVCFNSAAVLPMACSQGLERTVYHTAPRPKPAKAAMMTAT